jgi:hypothetical protein
MFFLWCILGGETCIKRGSVVFSGEFCQKKTCMSVFSLISCISCITTFYIYHRYFFLFCFIFLVSTLLCPLSFQFPSLLSFLFHRLKSLLFN